MKKSWIANSLTAANIAFGSVSILLSLIGQTNAAAVAILLAMVSDSLDGRVARKLGTSGPFGVELDSLCDCTSFGVAPGILLYSYQLHGLDAFGMIPCIVMAVCCAFRLARFNVEVTSVHGYFEGLPCPTVGVLIACYILSGVEVWDWLAFILAVVLSLLMVSEIHYPDNKGASADQLHFPAFAVCVVFFVLCTFIQPSVWAAALCTAYVVFGAANTWMNRRKRMRRLRDRRNYGIGSRGDRL